jgi:hypothetical protein
MNLKMIIYTTLLILNLAMVTVSCENDQIEKEVNHKIIENEKRVKSVAVQDYYMDPNETDGGNEYQSETKNNDSISDEELIRKWTWNEEIKKPCKSSISHTTFEPNLLLKEWSLQGDIKPTLQITEEYFVVIDLQFVYTVNYDSIRIFTDADHPGGGIERGIIKLINEDTLIIQWSTDDQNTYISSGKN